MQPLPRRLDVVVTDLGTGATSTMSGAFQFAAAPALPNVMKLLTAQAGNGFVNQATPVPFSVQVLAADGVTPVVGDAVTFSSAGGNVMFGACGAANCTVLTDANGVASSASTPLAVGSITLKATDGSLQQTANFTALAQSGSILVTSNLTSVPVGSTGTFSVRVLAPNGSAMSGRSVQFSALSGSVIFSGCFATVCSVVTNSSGNASLQITPSAPGSITLQASDGDVSVQSTFQATDNSDILRVVTAPPANDPLGQSAGLSILLLQHDGITPDTYKIVTFSGSPGINLGSCGSTLVCPLQTDHNGTAGVLAYPQTLGTYTLTATYGSVTQSVTFNVVPAAQVQIRILSAPTGSVVVGAVAPQPFTVQLLQPDGVTPLTNVRLTVAGPLNQVRLGLCNAGSCLASVDSRGMVTTSVTPLLPGAITLNAVYLPAIQTASFTALGPPATLQFTTQPGPAGVVVGASTPLSLQAVAIGGTGPGTGYVSLTVNQGSAIVSPCPAPCGNKWDPNGLTNFWVKAIAPGPISITAMWGAIRQTLNFYAYAVGDVMQLVSGPSGTPFTQIPAAPVFAVQVFGSDGVTPAPGKTVKFATSIGSVRFAACGAATCSVISDANGFASSAVTPTAEGVTTLTAYDGAANQAATFIAQDRPDVLSVVSAPAPGSYVGFAAGVPFSVRALWADGVTPAAGRSVTVAVTDGSASLAACAGASTCTLSADANGMTSTLVMPSAAGNVTLTVTDRTVQVMASFLAAVKPDQMLTISAPAGNVTLGNPALPAFAVRMLDGFGNPIARRAVEFTATGGGVQWSACPAAACTVLTAADGSAAITATPITAGAVVLVATSGAQSQSASITGVMPPDTLALVSVPANGSFAGSVAVTPFAVQVLAGYPVHPPPGKSVTMTVTGGSALFSACGQPVCTIVSDTAGVASSGVEPLAAGPITISAQEGGATLQQTFNSVLQPDLLTDVSLLPLQIHVGDTFTLKVQALAALGLGPDVGRSLQFTLASGTASLVGCLGPRARWTRTRRESQAWR